MYKTIKIFVIKATTYTSRPQVESTFMQTCEVDYTGLFIDYAGCVIVQFQQWLWLPWEVLLREETRK